VEKRPIFSERLIELRKEKGLLQRQLAKDLNITQSTISDWETARSRPNIYTLISFAKFFDVSADYLLGLKDDYN